MPGWGTTKNFSCLAAVQHWYNGDTTGQHENYGIMLCYNDTTIADYNSAYSADCTDANSRPLLTITYTPIYVDVAMPNGYLFLGNTQQAYCSTDPYGLPVTWYSSNTNIATVNSSGLVTAHSEGTARISAVYYHATSGKTYSDYVDVDVYSAYGLKDGTQYFIMNYNTRKLLSLETFSDANSNNVCTKERYNTAISKWMIDEQSDGRFQLINEYSTTGKVLHVSGTNLDIYTDNNSESEMFTICRINEIAYSGLYYIRYGFYYVAQDDNDNVYLTTTLSNKAIWSFSKANVGYADVFSHNYPYIDNGHSLIYDTTDNDVRFEEIFDEKFGYTTSTTTNSTTSNAYTILRRNNQQVFVFRGHGLPGGIAFMSGEGNTDGFILANSNMGYLSSYYYVGDCTDNELSSLRCVLYLGCSTGLDDRGYNLVDETYKKGAHFVLGTTETMYTHNNDLWLEYFLDAVSDGLCIDDACESANESIGTILIPLDDGQTKEYDGLPAYTLGDRIQYLDPI